MPEQCAPTMVFLIHTADRPHPAAPPPTPWCDYVVTGPEVFDRLSEWQLRTCQLHARAFPAVLQPYLDRCSGYQEISLLLWCSIAHQWRSACLVWSCLPWPMP